MAIINNPNFQIFGNSQIFPHTLSRQIFEQGHNQSNREPLSNRDKSLLLPIDDVGKLLLKARPCLGQKILPIKFEASKSPHNNDDDYVVPPLSFSEKNQVHSWWDSGGFSLVFKPNKQQRSICDVNVVFELNPSTGFVKVIIPKSSQFFCLSIENTGEIYSKLNEQVVFEFEPVQSNTIVKVFEHNETICSWEPNHLFDFDIDKLKPPLEIISRGRRETAINALADNKIEQRPVIEIANDWVGKGGYVFEVQGLIGVNHKRRPLVQDLKVIAFYATGDKAKPLPSEVEASEERIKNKTANLCCWQFCLLVYIEAGFLSKEAVGEVYKIADNEDLRITDPMKAGKFFKVDFNEDSTSPKAGDLVFFSNKINQDWHSAIFKKKNLDDTFSVIEIYSDQVTEENMSCNQTEGMTFVRAEDVEDNLLNFLAHKFLNSSS